jgi:hypothetical protein
VAGLFPAVSISEENRVVPGPGMPRADVYFTPFLPVLACRDLSLAANSHPA